LADVAFDRAQEFNKANVCIVWSIKNMPRRADHAFSDADIERAWFWTPTTTAKKLNVGRTTIWRMMKSGKLKTAMINKREMIVVASVRALQDQKKADAPATTGATT
jgi:hypothetical protein